MGNKSKKIAYPRKLFLHIGSDKAGSSALQMHLAANRLFLHRAGVYLPKFGGAGVNGHHGLLFKEFTDSNITKLVEEIDALPDNPSLLISWEGIHRLSGEVLGRFRQIFDNCDFHIIFYVREQADIIQTGFLQQIKEQERNAADIYSPVEYKLVSRDYYQTIKKFEGIFPGCSVDVVLFDRSNFPGGNIAYDFFSRIVNGVNFDELVIYDHEVNTSLGLEEVQILAFLEKEYPELCNDFREGRKTRIIDLLLSGKSRNSSKKTSYFFSKEQVEECRKFYRESNTALVEEYNVSGKILSDNKPVWNVEDNRISSESETLNQFMGQLDYFMGLANIPYMDRDARNTFGISLSSLLTEGWSSMGQGDNWTVGGHSTIVGCLRLQSITPLIKFLRFGFVGRYLRPFGRVSTVFVNGECMGEFDLGFWSIEYPIEKVGYPYVITIDIIHKDSIPLSDTEPTEAEGRRISYNLQKFSCTFARKSNQLQTIAS